MPKSSKKGSDNINSKLAIVMKSGRVAIGYKTARKAIRQKKAKAVFIAKNCPPLRKSEIEYLAFLGKNIQVYRYNGDNNTLGTACGKYYGVSVMAIINAGDSDILSTDDSKDSKKK